MLNKKLLLVFFILFISTLTSVSNASLSEEETLTKPRSLCAKLWDGVRFAGRASRFFTNETLKAPAYAAEEVLSAVTPTIPALAAALGTSGYVLWPNDKMAFDTPEAQRFLGKLFLRGTTNFVAQNLGHTDDFAAQYLLTPRSENPVHWLVEAGAENIHISQMMLYWHKSLFDFNWENTSYPITPQIIAQSGTIIALCAEILPKENTVSAYCRSALKLTGTCLGAGLLGTTYTVLGGGLPGAVIGLGAAKIASDIVFDGINWIRKAYSAYQYGFRE